MKQRVYLYFESETPGGSEPEGKAKAAALVRYSSRKPNHSNADNIPCAECTQQEIQPIFFPLSATHRMDFWTVLFPQPYRAALLSAERCSSCRRNVSLLPCRHLVSWKLRTDCFTAAYQALVLVLKLFLGQLKTWLQLHPSIRSCLFPVFGLKTAEFSAPTELWAPAAFQSCHTPSSSHYHCPLKYCWWWLKLQNPMLSAHFWPWEESS